MALALGPASVPQSRAGNHGDTVLRWLPRIDCAYARGVSKEFSSSIRHAIVFDLDGTLVDSGCDLALSVNATRRVLGLAPLPEADVLRALGDGARMLVQRCTIPAPEYSLDEKMKIFNADYEVQCLAHTKLYSGILEMLEDLHRRARLFVLTNKSTKPAEAILRRLGVDQMFERVIGGDGPLGRKPEPRGLLALIEQSEVPKARALMVGDGPADVGAARSAGIAILGFAGTLNVDEKLERAQPDCVVHDVSEMHTWINKWLLR